MSSAIEPVPSQPPIAHSALRLSHATPVLSTSLSASAPMSARVAGRRALHSARLDAQTTSSSSAALAPPPRASISRATPYVRGNRRCSARAASAAASGAAGSGAVGV